MVRKYASQALVALSLILVSAVAHADSLPPAAIACDGAKAGAACVLDGAESGTCQSQTCKSAGRPNGDGGFTPGTESPCLVCVANGSGSGQGGGGGCNAGSVRTFDFALIAGLGVIAAFAFRRRRS